MEELEARQLEMLVEAGGIGMSGNKVDRSSLQHFFCCTAAKNSLACQTSLGHDSIAEI